MLPQSGARYVGRRALSGIPEPLRVWDTTRFGVAAWAVALAVGYFSYIRPKWYPVVEHDKAKPFTPKEVEEWNMASRAQQPPPR